MPNTSSQEPEQVCALPYTGEPCDCPCKVCDEWFANKADEADYSRREDDKFRAWLDGAK